MNRLGFVRFLGVLVCLFFVSVRMLIAQGQYVPITLQNVADLVQVKRIGNGVPRAMTFSPDGSRLAIATALGVWVMETSNGTEARCTSTDTACRLIEGQGGVESAVFSPDGSKIAAGGDDNSVMVFDAASGKMVARLVNHIYPISAVLWSLDGKWIASGDWSGVVRIWDTSTWSEYRVLPTSEKIDALEFNAAITQLTAMSSDTRTTWDIASSAVLSQVNASEALGNALEASNAHYHAAIRNETLHFYRDNAEVWTVAGFYGEFNHVHVEFDGENIMILWSQGNDTTLSNPFTTQPVLSPDGTRKAIFGNDGVIRLFDTKTGNLIAQLHGHIRAINAVAFSPDGKLLASASNDDTIQLWDATVTQDSGSLMTLKGHTSGVTSVAFNAAGTLLVSASFDGTIRVWGVAQPVG